MNDKSISWKEIEWERAIAIAIGNMYTWILIKYRKRISHSIFVTRAHPPIISNSLARCVCVCLSIHLSIGIHIYIYINDVWNYRAPISRMCTWNESGRWTNLKWSLVYQWSVWAHSIQGWPSISDKWIWKLPNLLGSLLWDEKGIMQISDFDRDTM